MSGIAAHGADENHISDDSFAQNVIEVIQINQDEAYIGREGNADFSKIWQMMSWLLPPGSLLKMVRSI